MAGDNKTPLIPVSAVLVILAALGVTMFVQPFKGGRPFVSEYRESYERVNARLWQDPFQAVVDSMKEEQAPEDVGQLSIDDTVLNPREQRSFRSSYLSGIRGKDMVTVLAVMVPGNPYFEGTETRMRYRYALLSGLKRVGYVSEDAEHIEFIRIGSRNKKITLSNIIPVEWLSHENDNDEVLVLWINDDVFERIPLSKLARVIAYIKGTENLQNTKVEVNIIGPAISGTLKDMVKEVDRRQSREGLRPLKGVRIFSPWATVGSVLLVKRVPGEINTEDDALGDIKKHFWYQGITLVRTIGPDQALVDQLVSELQNRKVDLLDDKNHLLLVAEWDTFYARSFRNLFVEALKDRGAREERADPRIHFISYLRGIDGSLPGEKGDSDKKDPKADAKSDPSSDVKKLEQPIGKSQYDYLRRLADATYHLNRRLLANDGGEIKAIGVMGSDFYDKYLVLQALRQEFPGLIFFTTDLDARFLHPDNIKWTRNVVVASNFGLSLREDLQGEIPPFRDNYQTSTFLTVLRVFNKKWPNLKPPLPKEFVDKLTQEKPDRSLSPQLVFEIGRRRAVCLTDTTGTVHPPRDQIERGIWYYITIALIAVLALLVISFIILPAYDLAKQFPSMVRKHKLTTAVVAVLVLACGLGVYYMVKIANMVNEEPFSILEGVSVWPTEILRFVAFLLALLFLYLSYKSLSANKKVVDDEFDIKDGEEQHARRWWNMVFELDWEPEEVKGKRGLRGVWLEYTSRNRERYRIVRLIIIVLLYSALCCLILHINMDRSVTPVRGPKSYVADQIMLIISGVFLVVLIFYVIDVTRCCRRFITLASEETAALYQSRGKVRDKVKNELNLLHVIAARTNVVSQLIFYPFVVWLIMFAARFDYFDNWTMPYTMAVVISLGAVLAWSCAFLLRRSAEKTRGGAEGRLKQMLRDVKADQNPSQTLTSYIESALDEVTSIRAGAFVPFTQHPVLQSLLVPFGGVGGIYLVDFLAKVNF